MAEYTTETPATPRVMAYNKYPFEIAYPNNINYNYLDTSPTYDSNSTSTLVLNGTTRRKLRLRMSPYAQENIYGDFGEQLTTRSINTIVNNYVDTLKNETGSSLNIRRPYDKNCVSDKAETTSSKTGTEYKVTYENPGWTFIENSWVSGYSIDSIENTLTVDIETADYHINSTDDFWVTENSLPFNNCIFRYSGTDGETPAENQEAMKRRKIRNNLIVKRRHRGDPFDRVRENERTALETLREMITEKEFRKYLRYGFVLVPGESGAVYQIFRHQQHTKVWKDGKLVEEVCVRIRDGSVPSTDNVIAFATMIRTDEEEFKKMGNVYKMAKAA